MKTRAILVSAAIAAGTMIGFSSAAHADSPTAAPVTASGFHSVLTVDGKRTDLGASPAAVIPAGQPTGQVLPCGTPNTFIDANGTYTVQHACGGTTASWSYRLSTTACATAAGTVNEAGQIWALNGVTKPKQAPHPGVICRYIFHGTYNPAHDNNSIAYSDVITWAVPGGGVATLQYYGHFKLSAYPCSPTSC
ncbi:hypothetical protein [Actinacidiphila paucisporea]|uniref:Uncharacterized protein n=1 Tax=Actinacidiphila paucisporea TaxID=310782 RepID=A0A1M6ZF45_9ACTN|nr:hypothetical protein [Actinacidiphila paucisporea]SHL29060.1 hypothetical protein SAMN05216499_103309 [Actinacidiphila paucisporea]